jgi:hypothetical protein
MINPVRAELNAFLDGLPEDAEVGFITNNLATNTNGTYEVINSPNSLPDKMKAIAARISNEP